MEPKRFDDLARVLSIPDSRRRVLGLLAAVPIVGGLLGLFSPEETEAAGRRKRRKKAHKHGKGRKRPNRKHKKKKPQCTPTTCAEQGKTCGSISDGCGKTLDCGPCTCATGCPDCQTCNRDTGQCDPVTDGTACDDEDACTRTDTCQNGRCVGSNPVVCTPIDACHVAGICDPATGVCANPDAPEGTTCGQRGYRCQSGSCVCPAVGYEVVNGGCFKITNRNCVGCLNDGSCGCLKFGSANNFLCVQVPNVPCPDHVCAMGTACYDGSGLNTCVIPCPDCDPSVPNSCSGG